MTHKMHYMMLLHEQDLFYFVTELSSGIVNAILNFKVRQQCDPQGPQHARACHLKSCLNVAVLYNSSGGARECGINLRSMLTDCKACPWPSHNPTSKEM